MACGWSGRWVLGSIALFHGRLMEPARAVIDSGEPTAIVNPVGNTVFPTPGLRRSRTFRKESAMLTQSTRLPPPRICLLLGGPRRVAPTAEPRLAALLRPATTNGRTA